MGILARRGTPLIRLPPPSPARGEGTLFGLRIAFALPNVERP